MAPRYCTWFGSTLLAVVCLSTYGVIALIEMDQVTVACLEKQKKLCDDCCLRYIKTLPELTDCRTGCRRYDRDNCSIIYDPEVIPTDVCDAHGIFELTWLFVGMLIGVDIASCICLWAEVVDPIDTSVFCQ